MRVQYHYSVIGLKNVEDVQLENVLNGIVRNTDKRIIQADRVTYDNWIVIVESNEVIDAGA